MFLTPFVAVKYIYGISVKKALIDGSEHFPICLLEAFLYLMKLFLKNEMSLHLPVVICRVMLLLYSVRNLSSEGFQSWLHAHGNTTLGRSLLFQDHHHKLLAAEFLWHFQWSGPDWLTSPAVWAHGSESSREWSGEDLTRWFSYLPTRSYQLIWGTMTQTPSCPYCRRWC